MTGIQRKAFSLMAMLLLAPAILIWAQDKKQDIPDAPSAAQPPQPFPENTPPEPKEQPKPNAEQPKPNEEQPRESKPVQPPLPFPGDAPAATAPATAPGVQNMPASTPKGDGSDTREDLYKFRVTTNFVQVPVTVKDQDGRLVSGLVPKDFQVLENGQQQKMTFFTSDPFPLSAAVIVDLGMPDSVVQKVNRTFSALQGAFSQFDEVSLYVYSGTVTHLTGFGAVGQELTDTLNELKTKRGKNDGVPVTSGPFGPQGPAINGTPVGSAVPVLITPPKESHVINDAILAAALDLSKRDRSRRKIIFVISDGRELGSIAGYSDVLKVLLTNGVVVYGLGVGGAAAPIYGKLQKFHLPRLGTGDILPKYSSATGGELFTEISKDDIDAVYARAIGDARYQYTLGYVSKAAPGGAYREIEVRVARPDCSNYASPCIRTFAKAGYYPAPPAR
jgi:VWFA-related protein